MQEKKAYEKPEIEVIEFIVEESIAQSAQGAWFNDTIWGDE